MISEKPYNVAFLRSILCGTDPSCKQTNQLNVSTMARQATWQGSVQVPWTASHQSHLLGKTSQTLFVMLARRQDTKLSPVPIDQFLKKELDHYMRLTFLHIK